MKNILKYLKKANRIDLKNHKIKQSILHIEKAFKPFNINFTFKTELDYFEALIAYQALKNKQAFEALYEVERNDLFDLWDNLSYQERNRLIQIKLNVVKEKYPYFKTENKKVIWIAFFDTLLNGLYHNDIAIFELHQYFKLYKDFKDRRISVREYQFLPYLSSYIDVSIIQHQNDVIYFYSFDFASIFELKDTFECNRIPLDKEACRVQPLMKDLLALVNSYRKHDTILFMQDCIQSTLISDKTKKVFKKQLAKLNKT